VKRWDIFAEPEVPVSAPTTDIGAGPITRLSVVIASSNEGALLEQCLDALAPQAASQHVEILVVRASDRATAIDRNDVTARMPWVRWIDAPLGATVPELRGLGIAAARADRVALLEDDCVVSADWCRQAATVPSSVAAVGGAVEPGPYRRGLDWAVYFCEYGRFMLPVSSAPSAPLTGNNVVYSRTALEALPEDMRAQFREVFVHSEWHRTGVPTQATGSLIVHNINTWSVAHVTSGPFHHGRAYAAQRFGARSGVARACLAALTLGLPFLKSVRIASEVISRGRLVGRLALAFPWILVFVTSWSAGELAGCLWGPGTSATRWR
jgi:hypothetical protein